MRRKKQTKDERGIVKGTRLNYNAGDIAWYNEQLKVLIEQMATATRKQIVKLFDSKPAEQFFAEDASITSQSRILLSKLMEKFELLFGKKAGSIATRLTERANKASKSGLNYSLKDAGEDLTINSKDIPADLKEVMKGTIEQNVALIKSIPSKYFDDVQGAVYRSITVGNGLQDLVPEIKKYEGITNRRARFIASDQTRKTYAAINEQRMRSLDLPGFQFIHSGGGHEPRPSHVAMDGKYYLFSDLPWINADNPKEAKRYGMPGTEPNCKCTAAPVVILPGDAPIKWEKVRQ